MDNDVAMRMAREIALAMEKPVTDYLGEGELADWYRKKNVLDELLSAYRTPGEQEYLQNQLSEWEKQRPLPMPIPKNSPLYTQQGGSIQKLHDYVNTYVKKENE